MTAQSAILEVFGLAVKTRNRTLLDNVSFRILPGEIVTIIGPNGGGKTTLLRAIVGAIPITAGNIVKDPALRIGYSPQRLATEQSMPVTSDRFLALAGRFSSSQRLQALEVTGASDLANLMVSDLSGGEIQRVLLARALLRGPNLLILDEPTQGLDQLGEERFYSLLEKIRADSGLAVLMVSHDIHVVMAASDHVICLNGHVCCAGAPEAVSVDPNYLELFGSRAKLAVYQHHHDHSHDGHDHAGHQHG